MAEEFAADFAPKEMPISELYESSIKNAYAAVRDTAAKSSLVCSKTEPRSKEAVDFDFDTELRRTRRLTLLDKPRYTYKTLKKDDKRMAGEPENLSSSEDEEEEALREQSGYIARRPYTAYDRETTVYGNRRYYSRSNDDDPDYFDYDLRHSIDLYRKPKPLPAGGSGSYFNSRVVSSNPALWDTKDFKELCSYKPDRLLSSQLYSERTRKLLEDDSAEGAAEGETVAAAASNGTDVDIDKGLMAAALRTPAYWTRRFESLTNRK